MPRIMIVGPYGGTTLSFARNCQAVSQSDHTIVAFPPTMLFHTITTIGCCHLALLIETEGLYILVIFHCCFNLKFLNDMWFRHLSIRLLLSAYLLWCDTMFRSIARFKIVRVSFLEFESFFGLWDPLCWVLGVHMFWISLFSIFISSLLRYPDL